MIGGMAIENAAFFFGGVFAISLGSSLRISGCTTVRNQAGNMGGVIAVVFDSHLHAANMVSTGDRAEQQNGGAVLVAQGSDATITSSSFEGHVAGQQGGAMFFADATSVVLDSVNISNSTALTSVGGGITSLLLTDCLKMTRVRVEHCSSAGHGGAIFTDSDLEVLDSTFAVSWAADAGGGLYCATGLTFSKTNMTNVVFHHNAAGTSAGAMFIQNTAAVLTNVTLQNNRAVGGDGGAIQIGSVGIPTDVMLVDVAIADNNADAGAGGGVFVNDDARLTATRTRIERNRAQKRGGGIACAGSAVVVLDDAVDVKANAAGDGGGVSLGDEGASLFGSGAVRIHANNAVTGNGGAVHAGRDGTVEYFAGCEKIVFYATSSSGEWTNVVDDGNVAVVAVGDDGIALPSSCCVDALGRSMIVNVASIRLANSGDTFAMEYCLLPGSYTAFFSSPCGGNFDINRALLSRAVRLDARTRDGVQLFESTTQPVTFTIEARNDAGITMALTENLATGDGGGVWVGSGARLQAKGLFVSKNNADRDGGGVHAYIGVIDMMGGEISGNAAGRDGGAISLGLLSSATLDATVCIGNLAVSNGGGVATTKDARLSASGLFVTGNSAGSNGGGVALSETPMEVSTLTNCTVANNTARGALGGGLYTSNAGLVLDSSRVESNRVGAGSGGGLASVAQEDVSLTATVFGAQAADCSPIEVQLDWLVAQGSCEAFPQLSQDGYGTCDAGILDSCQSAYEGLSGPGSTLYRSNCTGCPCNSIFATRDMYETFATIFDADISWDGWSFLTMQDANGKDTFATPRAKAFVSEKFCLAPGLYTFAAMDKMMVPRESMWWGGTYRLVVDGTVIAHSGLGSYRATFNFTVVNKTDSRKSSAFVGNEALRGGGGGVYWDASPPDDRDTDTHFSENVAAYGSNWASDAVTLALNWTSCRNISIYSGQSMSPPIVVELRDGYGQRVKSDDASSVVAKLVDGPLGSTSYLLDGPLVLLDAGVGTFSDLSIDAEPGAKLMLELTVTTLGDPIPQLRVELTLENDCPLGEVKETTNQGNVICTKCPMFMFHSAVSKECRTCVRGMSCDKTPGLDVSTVAIERGYWRSGNGIHPLVAFIVALMACNWSRAQVHFLRMLGVVGLAKFRAPKRVRKTLAVALTEAEIATHIASVAIPARSARSAIQPTTLDRAGSAQSVRTPAATRRVFRWVLFYSSAGSSPLPLRFDTGNRFGPARHITSSDCFVKSQERNVEFCFSPPRCEQSYYACSDPSSSRRALVITRSRSRLSR